jgi:hypothetical protein
MASSNDGYSKGAVSDSDLIHGCGGTGPVLHASARGADSTSSSKKGMDPGMSASLGRPKAGSDMKGPTPEDVSTAPGQRTVLKPKASTQPVKTY